jgi:dipeptidyl aminopeptidase/acylaminoacyl peptidase
MDSDRTYQQDVFTLSILKWRNGSRQDLPTGCFYAPFADKSCSHKGLLRQDIADPKRICLFGSGYGGYAAITAAAQAPDMYRCAIGLNGTYDPSILSKTTKLTANVLVMHDDKHREAPIAQAKTLTQVFDNTNTPYQYLEVNSDIRGIEDQKNRRKVYQAVLDFIAKQMGL